MLGLCWISCYSSNGSNQEFCVEVHFFLILSQACQFLNVLVDCHMFIYSFTEGESKSSIYCPSQNALRLIGWLFTSGFLFKALQFHESCTKLDFKSTKWSSSINATESLASTCLWKHWTSLKELHQLSSGLKFNVDIVLNSWNGIWTHNLQTQWQKC